MITIKPFSVASKTTVSGWVRKALALGGVDLDKFSPHSTRSAASSKMKKANVSLTTIINTAGWKNHKTFAKYYHKKIVSQAVSVENLL